MNDTDLSLVTTSELVDELASRLDDVLIAGLAKHTDDSFRRLSYISSKNPYALIGLVDSMKQILCQETNERYEDV